MKITKHVLPGDVAYTTGHEFADAIRSVIQSNNIKTAVETGTYLGTGTTAAILSGLPPDGRLLTIECNPLHYFKALPNLLHDTRVTPLLGLSVPRPLLPSCGEIVETCVFPDDPDVFVDHDVEDRLALYHAETDFPSLPYDLLAMAFALFGNRPDLVLLDSAGHMGFVEFNHVLSLLRHEFILCADDVNHVKHTRSKRFILANPSRFTVLHDSKEKFGSMIVKVAAI